MSSGSFSEASEYQADVASKPFAHWLVCFVAALVPVVLIFVLATPRYA